MAFVWFVKLLLLFRRRVLLRGTFELFIKCTTLTSLWKNKLRKRKVRELKSQLIGQQTFFTQQNWQTKADTEALLRVSHSIIKHKKSFQDGDMIKEAFVEAADSLFRDFKNKLEISSSIKALQLSRCTVTQRCEVVAENLTQQLRRDIADCGCFSLQLDKSTDTSDTAQLCIFIKMVFIDMTAKEELLTLLPIYQAFKIFIEKTTTSWCVNCVQY